MTECSIDPADEEQQQSSSADGDDAAEDQALGAGEEDVAVVGDAARTGEVETVLG